MLARKLVGDRPENMLECGPLLGPPVLGTGIQGERGRSLAVRGQGRLKGRGRPSWVLEDETSSQ